MIGKKIVTKTELEKLLMDELCKHPECAEISGVTVSKTTNGNWDIQFSRRGKTMGNPVTNEIVIRFRQQFALE